ncbi:hypothetical protein K440DRAFT_637502 [Wilcoxina mikolae CBS 423.85]|nr:hypothetical protein K440DRAFT_637502 [Wilcoxina mikolae CBS 423.85]
MSARDRDQYAPLARRNGDFEGNPDELMEPEYAEEEEDSYASDGVQELQSILGLPVNMDSIIIPPAPPKNPSTPVPKDVFDEIPLGEWSYVGNDEEWEVVTKTEVAMSVKRERQRRIEEEEEEEVVVVAEGVEEGVVEDEESDDSEEDEEDL